MKLIYSYLLLLLITACNAGTSEESTTAETAQDTASDVLQLTDAQWRNAGVETDSLRQITLSEVIRVNGSIDVPPQNMVSVSVPLGGYLLSTHLLPGEHISKGQSIAVMQDFQYIQLQQDYLTTQSQLQYDELEFNRQKELNSSKAVSDKVYQQAETQFHRNQIVRNALAQKLRLININPAKLNAGNISQTVQVYSPINGFVSKVNVNIGKYVNPTDVLFELVNPSDIHLNLIVFEKDVSKLSIGQELFAYSNNEPEKKYRCKIILISKDLSPERSVEVHCHFEDYDKTLLPGMYMNAIIKTSNRKVYAVPENAVVNHEGKDFVFVETGRQTYRLTHVQTGISETGFTEIKNADALTAKPVVTIGAYTLLMKLKNTADEEE